MDVLTSEGLHLLIFGLLHLVCDFCDDKILRAHLPNRVDQGIQAAGVLSQYVQQHGHPLGLRSPAADLFCIISCQDPARAQVVQVAICSDFIAEVVPQSGQHLESHRKSRRADEKRAKWGVNEQETHSPGFTPLPPNQRLQQAWICSLCGTYKVSWVSRCALNVHLIVLLLNPTESGNCEGTKRVWWGHFLLLIGL